MSTTKDTAICPLNGMVCPGVSHCAPAVFAARVEEVHTQQKAELRCPVAALVGAVELAAAALLGHDVEPLEPPKPTRESVLRSLLIDQEE